MACFSLRSEHKLFIAIYASDINASRTMFEYCSVRINSDDSVAVLRLQRKIASEITLKGGKATCLNYSGMIYFETITEAILTMKRFQSFIII